MQEFERTRLDIGGQPVTITSWYDDDKHRWRANAPAYGHLLNISGTEADPITGTTREKAIQAAHGRLAQMLANASGPRR
jgi:hypothetical protein